MRNPWRVVIILALVWIVAAGVISWMRSIKPTAESVATYIHAHSLAGLSADQRAKVIEHTAQELNRLDFNQREALRRSRADRDLYKQMTAEEQQHFLDETLPEGFHQFMIALNTMDPERRKRIVRNTLNQIQKDDPDMDNRMPPAEVQKMTEQGLQSFYNDANADVKLDFAPVIEQLQRNTQK